MTSVWLALVLAQDASKVLYAGTYSKEGIYLLRMNPETGALSSAEPAAAFPNASYLALHPTRRYLYAVGELNQGAVGAFAADPSTGKLTFLNTEPSGGRGPCYIAVDHRGKNVLVAHYTGGSVSVLPIGEDGRVGRASAVVQHKGKSVNPRRQEAPHAHSINVDAADKFAFAADLGLDKILVYAYDPDKSALSLAHEGAVPPGSGPRHFAFHPSERWAYSVNELTSAVTTFSLDGGQLKELQTISALPEGYSGENSGAHILVSKDGRFVYSSNRGHNSIAIFSVDEKAGTLKLVSNAPTGGKTPRNFEIDPSGKFLLAANQDSNLIKVFRINEGMLQAADAESGVPKPVCVKFLAPQR